MLHMLKGSDRTDEWRPRKKLSVKHSTHLLSSRLTRLELPAYSPFHHNTNLLLGRIA